MVGAGVVGLVGSLLATVLGFVLLGRVERSLRESLSVTEEAVAAFEDTLVLADQLVTDVGTALGSTRDTLAAVQASLGPSADALQQSAAVLEVLPGRLGQVDAGLDRLVGPAQALDQALGNLDRLGLGLSYDPTNGLSAQIAALSTALDGLPTDVADISEDLGNVALAAQDLETALEQLLADVDTINDRLGASESLVEEYQETAGEAALLATNARRDLSRDIGLMRVLVVFVGLAVAAGQAVPLWTGSELLARSANGIYNRSESKNPVAANPGRQPASDIGHGDRDDESD